MKGIIYQKYHIIGVARLSENTRYWVPTVRVVWRDGGKEQKFELDGPSNRFSSREEAEDYAILMGKDWIDRKTPVP
ncbi:MAG: hypothetical protein ACREQ7_00975 [Candidatus Binatia bacterium]